jgi:hypothetical protein
MEGRHAPDRCEGPRPEAVQAAGRRPAGQLLMARRAPTGPPATVLGWVYTLCLDPPYPTPPCDNGHQVGHYTGISKWGNSGLEGRMAVQAEGGPDAARLLQVQKAAGGTFVLVSVEWGTQDRETALKYRGATSRCSRCKTGSPAPGEPAPVMGWVCIVHLDPPGPRQAPAPGPAGPQPAHRAVFIDSTESMYAALGRGGREVARVLQLPEAHGGSWRLVSAKWAAPDRVKITERRAASSCPACRAARAQARAAELLAAIGRGEVADRFSPLTGDWDARWHTRDGQPVVADDPGGTLGRNVTQIAAALVRRGLVKRAAGPRPGADYRTRHADRPYLLTRAGKAALRGPRPRRGPSASAGPYPRRRLAGFRAVSAGAAEPRPRADGLPVRRDGGLNLAKCTDAQRAGAGAMTRRQAREHKALRTVDERVLDELLGPGRRPRRAERVRGRLGDEHEWTAAAPPPSPPAPGPAGSLTGSPALPPGSAGQQETPVISLRPQAGASRRAAADLSWPSTVRDGVAAAAELNGDRPRRPGAAGREAAPRSTRGAGR